MEWNRLLSKKRVVEPAGEADKERSPFERDHDRIVFDSAFRRLQDKTQVHPLTSSDYVRKRLTHSLEVSVVGRSLGSWLGAKLIKRNGDLAEDRTAFVHSIAQVVSNACLAHDIGNPPFGHAGEEAIGSWFATNRSHEVVGSLTQEEFAQFSKFEGNAQGFRLLTRLQQSRNEGGLKLTYATLGAFTKYPCVCSASKGKGGYIGEKKFGFFNEDKEQFVGIADELELVRISESSWSRHPLVFLVEAADDICYRVVDVEDGWKLSRLSFAEAEECFVSFLADPSTYKREADESANIGWLRAKAIGSLIRAVEEAFADHESAIMDGTFSQSLIDATSLSGSIQTAKSLVTTRVFDWNRTVDAEIAGVEMITTVLQKCMDAVGDSPSKAGTLLRKIIPSFDESLSPLGRAHVVADYVSGMTDSYMKQTYFRLTGHAHV